MESFPWPFLNTFVKNLSLCMRMHGLSLLLLSTMFISVCWAGVTCLFVLVSVGQFFHILQDVLRLPFGVVVWGGWSRFAYVHGLWWWLYFTFVLYGCVLKTRDLSKETLVALPFVSVLYSVSSWSSTRVGHLLKVISS